MTLEELKKPIKEIKWRVQSSSKRGTICVPYIDARHTQNLLDEVCGPNNWQTDFKEIGGNLYGGIGIKIDNEWIWKCRSSWSTSRIITKGVRFYIINRELLWRMRNECLIVLKYC